MRGSLPDSIPATLERVELKYVIPLAWVVPMVQFIAPYCRLDSHSADSPAGYYEVNSLYLDTPRYLFYRNRLESVENRFTMRVRYYGTYRVEETILYPEIKQKRSSIVRKYRFEVRDQGYGEGLDPFLSGADADHAFTDAGRHRELFKRLVLTYDAAPVVLICYRRMAYVSCIDDYARVTFDTDLRCREMKDYHFGESGRELLQADVETLYDPTCSVILELKSYATQIPWWMIDLIRHFDLRRRSFSKYSAGLQRIAEIMLPQSDRHAVRLFEP